VDFGEFDLSVFKSFPDLNFEIKDVIVIGIDDFENDTLASVKDLSTEVDLFSIMGDEIKVKAIIIDNADVTVKVLKDGKANYDIAKEDEEGEEEEAEEDEEEGGGFKLGLKKFIISNTNIVYDDREMDVLAEITGLDFSLKGDMTEDFTSLSTTSDIQEMTLVYEGMKYLNKAKMNMQADLDADLANSVYTFKDNVAVINALELGFDGKFAMPGDDYDMDLTFEAKKTEFKNILSMIPAVYMKDFENVQTSGKLALNGNAKGIYNDETLPAFGLKLVVENAMFKYPDLPKSAENINIDVNVVNDGGGEDNTVIDVNRFHVEMAGNPLDVKMHTETPVSDPRIEGEIKGKLDFNSIKDIVPLEDMTIEGQVDADVKLKGSMSSIDNEQYEEFLATGQIDLTNFSYKSEDLPQGMVINKSSLIFSPQFVELASFDSKIGRSDINMKGRIDNFLAYYFRDELLKGKFDFQSNMFDVNEFMTEEAPGEVAAEGATEEEELSVVEVPENIDFLLNTSIGKILYDKLDITNFAGSVHVHEGMVEMKDVVMNMLDGNMKLSGSYSTQDMTKPQVDLDMMINRFDIQKSFDAFNTIQKLAPIAENCTGRFSTGLVFKSLLAENMDPVYNSIEGEGRLRTHDVVVTRSDVMAKIADKIKQKKFKENMKLEDLDLYFTIKDGKVSVEPCETTYENAKALFAGWQGIDQTLGYVLNMKIPRSNFGDEANQQIESWVSNAKAKGIDVDVDKFLDFDINIGGTITDPKITVKLKDPSSGAIDAVKDKIKEEIDKKKEELEKKAREEADKLKQKAAEEAERLRKEAEKKSKAAQEEAKRKAEELKKKAEAEAKKAKEEAAKKAKEEAKKKFKDIW